MLARHASIYINQLCYIFVLCQVAGNEDMVKSRKEQNLETTGAVYHHFASKKGLFVAVAEDLEAEILGTAASVTSDDPWQRLRLGFEKLIDLCASPAVQRIIFVEAPQVVGPDAWRKIELRYAFGTLRTVLTALRDANIIKPYPVDLIARTLLALLHETSAEVARSKHDPKIRAQISDLVAGVLDVFLVR